MVDTSAFVANKDVILIYASDIHSVSNKYIYFHFAAHDKMSARQVKSKDGREKKTRIKSIEFEADRETGRGRVRKEEICERAKMEIYREKAKRKKYQSHMECALAMRKS